jgi:hypothetical protein
MDARLEAFATAHGYTMIHRGRYPNRYLSQHDIVMRSIEIAMDMDERGQRFDHFFPEIPYIVWCGAWIDDTSTQARFSSPHLETWPIPFSALERDLTAYLDHFHSYLASVTEDFIRTCGTASKLVLGPPVSEL